MSFKSHSEIVFTDKFITNTNWKMITDQVMGGISQGQLNYQKIGYDDAVILTGKVSTKNNGGFIQIRRNLNNVNLNNVKKVGNLKINFQDLMNSSYIEMNKTLNESLKKSVNDLNFTFVMMDSGAGHDTAHLAKVSKASIIFIPCQNGLSHCPAEFTNSINIKKVSEVILKSILDLKDNHN